MNSRPLPDELTEQADAKPLAGCGPLSSALATSAVPLKQQVFECVRAAGQIARVDVARQVDVSPATVTAAVQDLMAMGLLAEVETRPRDRHRGRPPVALAVRGDAGVVVGMKLSDKQHSAIVLDLAGKTRGKATLSAVPRGQFAEDLVSDAKRLYDAALSNADVPSAAVQALGVGLPGRVDHATGGVFWSPLLIEADPDFRARLTNSLGVLATVDNDANMVTLAELWFGAGRKMRNFAVVTIEQGVGMGMVIDHSVYRGARGFAMELGHMKVQLDGALCRCGQRGCLEAYLADYALVREASTALNWTPPVGAEGQILLESLFDEAKAGNEAARTIFRRAGRFLAVALANVTNLFDPATIILSGERLRFDYLYAETVLTEMRAMSMIRPDAGPRVEVNAWGGLVWAQGAAALALADSTSAVVSGLRGVP